MKSTGRRVRTSPSRPSRRKIKTKRKPSKKKSTLSSIFSRKSTSPKTMRKTRTNLKKMKTKKTTKSQNLKDNTKSQMNFMKTWFPDHLSTSWEWLVVISETSVTLESWRESRKVMRMRRKRLQRRRKGREREKVQMHHQEEMNEGR